MCSQVTLLIRGKHGECSPTSKVHQTERVRSPLYRHNSSNADINIHLVGKESQSSMGALPANPFLKLLVTGERGLLEAHVKYE